MILLQSKSPEIGVWVYLQLFLKDGDGWPIDARGYWLVDNPKSKHLKNV